MFVPPSYATSVEALVVAGGGAGGYRRGGGGGAGGLLHYDAFPVTGGATYDITVGAGGLASGTYTEFGGNGTPSSISTNNVTLVTAIGGGAGGNGDSSCAAAMCDGRDGGSGGGSGAKVNTDTNAGAGEEGQGYAGGIGRSGSDKANNKWGGGGGGANAAGGSVAMGTTTSGGNGGEGKPYSISGEETYYAGGGGGGGEYSQKDSTTAGASSGGKGGGGKGGQRSADAGTEVAESGKAGTGGGGGGGSNETGHFQGGDGGSGIVIFRYAVQGNGQGINEPAIALESLDRVADTNAPNHGLTTIGYRLAWAGDNYDYADVKVAWGFSKDNLSNTNAIASSVIGRGTGTFTLPDQTKTVYVRAVAVNAGGYGAMSPKVVTIPFVDPEAPEVELPVVSSITGTGASFSAAVTGLGDGATSVQGVFQVSTDKEFEGTILSFPAAQTLTAVPDSLTATATGLSPNTAYYVRVSATNNVPDFFETEPVPFRTAVPGTPNGSVVTDPSQVADPPAECEPPVATATTITAWGYLFTPGNNGASYADMRLEASTTANFQTVAAYTATEAGVTERGYRSFTLENLEPETAYYLRLRMENDGRVVKHSDVVGPFTTLAPSPPGVLFLIY